MCIDIVVTAKLNDNISKKLSINECSNSFNPRTLPRLQFCSGDQSLHVGHTLLAYLFLSLLWTPRLSSILHNSCASNPLVPTSTSPGTANTANPIVQLILLLEFCILVYLHSNTSSHLDFKISVNLMMTSFLFFEDHMYLYDIQSLPSSPTTQIVKNVSFSPSIVCQQFLHDFVLPPSVATLSQCYPTS